MEWLEVIIYTTTAGIEPVSGRLYQLGINGVSIEDENEFNEFLEENRQCWDYVDDELVNSMHKETTVKLYLTNTPDGMETLAEVKQSMAELRLYDTQHIFGRLDIEVDSMNEEDWANNWKQYFHPLKVGDKILILPEWEQAENDDGRIVFTINPGMSFGTGSHHTTRMCIEQLEKVITDGCEMLDLGCGSGILGIISALLGAKSVFAVDIDPNAVDIAYQNAERNGVSSECFSAVAGNLLDDRALMERLLQKQYDVVCANIVADVIIALAGVAYAATKQGGVFIASGIIEDRIGDIHTALEDAGFKIEEISRSADWAAFRCVK